MGTFRCTVLRRGVGGSLLQDELLLFHQVSKRDRFCQRALAISTYNAWARRRIPMSLEEDRQQVRGDGARLERECPHVP